ncbi:MAG: ACP S-malonyltransferase [Paracoccaceae bacterium]|nr:ACP S-malonyltransferase [Paracoccaceae bacterium]
MIAFVFPGQGSQLIGMGKDIAEEFPVAKTVFEEVDTALGFPLSKLIWEGKIEELTLTINAQPAIMATSLAVVAALKSEGIDISKGSCVAGHSLGEYSALCAAGSISITDTACLLRKRGQYMQESLPLGSGSMAAILGLDIQTVTKVTEDCSKFGVCEIANDNDPNQVVISGEKVAIEKACDHAKSFGARRAVVLPVSAPFHCSLMTSAQEKMSEVLAEAVIEQPAIPIVSNVTASTTTQPSQVRENLVKQITGTVRWRESVMHMHGLGVQCFLEVGPGKVLSNLIKRIIKGVEQFSAGDVKEIHTFRDRYNV